MDKEVDQKNSIVSISLISETKEAFFEEFFKLYNRNSSILLNLQKNLKNTVKNLNLEEDRQLGYAGEMLTMFIAESLSNDVSKSKTIYLMVEEVIGDLRRREEWDVLDTKIASILSGYCMFPKLLQDFRGRILKECVNHKLIETQATVHLSCMRRISKISHYERHMNSNFKESTLEDLAHFCELNFKEISELCDKHNNRTFEVFRNHALVRYGTFYRDINKISEGLSALEDLKEYDLVQSLVEEIKDLFGYYRPF